ncbi:uncharacterized protein EI97DRAFT_409858 [Westerdykella ornata]|uniref:Glycoprotease family protein n=1 Tax=Westerdykella ornata TaxID=318751 RepID=A0A6A6K1H8_WESOR|nr:uncharacterized protein EI97DRAFT_409858 [Westerdykella ornata]KAF2281229.1 hypothetical protein EI97DRAFT_409858 [Westerdykella ornata]
MPAPYDNQPETLPIHLDDAYLPRNETKERSQWELDAQIAARKAMAKRHSRSYTARMSRTKSRKKDIAARPAKPTIDTSFARHKGCLPRQVYPKENDVRTGGSVKRPGWFGVNRSGTNGKGLGIMKGTPQPGTQPEDYITSPHQEPKTADSLMTPMTTGWMDISPSDRPIPIGISLPSDSLPDLSPYQTTRKRSESDATLITPSIIITPAAAMKSSATTNITSEQSQDSKAPPANRSRNGTLDSAGTAFEDVDLDWKSKDRIMSSSTVFEEDEIPLRGAGAHASVLSVDTSVVPTPRRSQGWWNYITTPFEFSRTNSVWTQGGRNGQRTPDIPILPQRFGGVNDPPASPSTYIWSATDKSPSLKSPSLKSPSLNDSPLFPIAFSTAIKVSNVDENELSERSGDQQSETNQPQQAAQQPPINVNIVFHDRRPDVEVHTVDVSRSFPPPPRQSTPASASSSSHKETGNQSNVGASFHGNSLVFPPPPHFEHARAQSASIPNSRTSSPVPSEFKKEKPQKQHRKVFHLADRLPGWLPFGGRARTKKQTKQKSRRKKWCIGCCCCFLILVLLAILIPVLVVVTRRNNSSSNNVPNGTQPPAQNGQQPSIKWLNLTGYPPMPTGISTIAQPEAVEEETGCIAPATAWSCAVPKEGQQAIKPNKPDQPNLRFEIIFENGTIADPSKTRPARRAANAVSAGAFIRSLLLRPRAPPSASPPAPNADHYKFLGETTDGNTGPFEGEETPFFLSFLDLPDAVPSRLLKRQASNITSGIPPPQLNPDGTAAPANLLPEAKGQPLRLFNRGKDNEHYGFFLYYDRSIFLKETVRNFTRGGNPADQDGGSPKEAATVRCTWAQTRFLVQIWTRSQTSKPLLGSSPNAPTNSDFKRPGSFPYPVTVTIDRHGGSATEKMLYCYKMEVDGKIRDLNQNKQFLREDRAFGGNLVRPGGGPVQDVGGVIDGGSGGCRCQWQNWLA